jgi:hypothetical protein
MAPPISDDSTLFVVELAPIADEPSRALGRAVSLVLANAIFAAALAAYPGARIVLKAGEVVIQDSGLPD